KDLTFAEIEKFHHSMKSTPYQANRCLAVLSKMMSWGIRRGDRPDQQNPCRGVERFKEQGRERFLTEAELARLADAIREAETVGIPWDINQAKPTAKHLPKDAHKKRTKINPFAAPAIRLLFFTGARVNEFLTAKWEHLDSEAGILRLLDSKT